MFACFLCDVFCFFCLFLSFQSHTWKWAEQRRTMSDGYEIGSGDSYVGTSQDYDDEDSSLTHHSSILVRKTYGELMAAAESEASSSSPRTFLKEASSALSNRARFIRRYTKANIFAHDSTVQNIAELSRASHESSAFARSMDDLSRGRDPASVHGGGGGASSSRSSNRKLSLENLFRIGGDNYEETSTYTYASSATALINYCYHANTNLFLCAHHYSSRFVLDPMGKAIQTWRLLLFPLIVYNAINVPFRMAYGFDGKYGFFFYFSFLTDVALLLDIFISFRTVSWHRYSSLVMIIVIMLTISTNLLL